MTRLRFFIVAALLPAPRAATHAATTWTLIAGARRLSKCCCQRSFNPQPQARETLDTDSETLNHSSPAAAG